METFQFKGNWETQINLPTLAKLRNTKFYNPDSSLEWIRDKAASLEKGFVDLKICDAPNNNEYPEDIQLNALNFLINNEEEIYHELFSVIKEIVYPYYGELVGEDLEEDDPLNSINDLQNAIAINEIAVDYIGKNNIAWVKYVFEFVGDYEHGLSLLFEGSKYLKHDSAFDMWYKDLLTQEELDRHQQDHNKHHDTSNPQLHYPNEKKKFFKPWELEQTKYFLIHLIKENREEEFKDIIIKDSFDINIPFPELNHTLIEEVVKLGKIELAKFMYENGAQVKGLLHQGNPYYENKHRIHLIGLLDENIDEQDANSKTLLDKYLDMADIAFRKNNFDKLIQYKEHIELLLKYGAQLNQPSEYKDLLNHWNMKSNNN